MFVMTATISDLHSFSSFVGRGSSSQEDLFDFEIIESISDSVAGSKRRNFGILVG